MQKSIVLVQVFWVIQLFSLSAGEAFLVNHGAHIVSEKDTWWVIDGSAPFFYSVNEMGLADFHNLRIANAALHLSCNAVVSVHGILQNDVGVSGLVLHANESSVASLIHHNEGVEATIYKYIPAVNDWHAMPATDWHMISAPLSGQLIQGFIPEDPGSGYDFYGWCETSTTWINFKNQDSFGDFNNGFLFNKGQGYLVAYEQDQLFSFTGSMHAGDVSCNNLTYTGTEVYAGWHLLGNPYPSSLDWNDPDWQRTEVLDEVHIWDRYSGNYIFNNNGIGNFSGVLRPHQGMFVKVKDNDNRAATLEIPAVARTHSTQVYNKNLLPQNSIRLEVKAKGSLYRDAHFVLLREDGSMAYDRRYDAHKINGMGHAPELFSRKGGRNLSIHSLPATLDQMQVPLWFSPGSFNHFYLSVSGLESLDDEIGIMLLDQHTGLTTDLRNKPELEFYSGDNSLEARFLLILNHAALNTDECIEKDIDVFFCEAYIHLIIPDHHIPAQLIVTAADGRQWINKRMHSGGLHQFRKPPVNGLLIVHVFSKSSSRTIKIINH